MQGTPQHASKVTTEFTYGGLNKERYCRNDVISELKCM